MFTNNSKQNDGYSCFLKRYQLTRNFTTQQSNTLVFPLLWVFWKLKNKQKKQHKKTIEQTCTWLFCSYFQRSMCEKNALLFCHWIGAADRFRQRKFVTARLREIPLRLPPSSTCAPTFLQIWKNDYQWSRALAPTEWKGHINLLDKEPEELISSISRFSG